MSISGVNGIGATAYAYMNSSMKTTGEGNFASEVQKAEERQRSHKKVGTNKMKRKIIFSCDTGIDDALALAYLAASIACVGLLAFYASHLLGGLKRGVGFATMLTMLYGVLYVLLVSENNALLMGSLLLFGILAAIMWITRKVDWYDVGGGLR